MTDALAPGAAVTRPEALLLPIVDQVRAAHAAGSVLRIRGGDTKSFYGAGQRDGEVLDTRALNGILSHEPSELVLTARAGTPLADIEQALAERGQALGFEPPAYTPATTLGGVIATGLSGPARPFRGSARDFVLGVEIVNGRGEVLRFGGQVMKNVAGYDISRLQCGALGTLGVITRVSLRVTPRSSREATLWWTCGREEAARRMRELQDRPWPLSGLAQVGDTLHARLAGSAAAVDDAIARLAPEGVESHAAIWQGLRDHHAALVGDDTPGDAAWRLSLPPAAPDAPGFVCRAVDWGGALRWIGATPDLGPALLAHAAAHGGHALRFRGPGSACFAAPPAPVQALMQRVKQAFDPAGIFNPGRLYPWL